MANQYSIDTVPLYGSSAIQNPTNPTAGADLVTAFSDASNRLTFVARPQDSDIGNITATPLVAATWNGSAFISGATFVGQPQLVVTAVAAAVAGATVTGSIALEGVTDLSAISANAPLGKFDIQIRSHSSGAVVFENKNVTLTASAGSAKGSYSFTATGVAPGTYDVWIKGGKNLAVLVPNVTVTATGGAVANVLLPAADANDDNSVDTSDFGVLVGGYNGDSAIPGSGYDPAADFNFDGVVDTTDFSLLVGQYNNVGAN